MFITNQAPALMRIPSIAAHRPDQSAVNNQLPATQRNITIDQDLRMRDDDAAFSDELQAAFIHQRLNHPPAQQK